MAVPYLPDIDVEFSVDDLLTFPTTRPAILPEKDWEVASQLYAQAPTTGVVVLRARLRAALRASGMPMANARTLESLQELLAAAAGDTAVLRLAQERAATLAGGIPDDWLARL